MADAGVSSTVRLEEVSVAYGRLLALDRVNVVFPPGAVGLLGPNGSGKTTVLRALLGFVRPARGRLLVFGLDVATESLAIRARLGYMPENDAHIPGMNAVSFVAYCGELAGLPAVDAMRRAHEVLQYVGLGEARYRNLETFSTGMKQRIKLAQALVHDPDLVLLDEPTNGMDPQGRDEMLALIWDLGHRKGMNLVLCSHLLPDVEQACDQVVVLDRGRVAAAGSIGELKGPGGGVYEVRIKGEVERFTEVLRAAGFEVHAADRERLRVFCPPDTDPRALFGLAVREGVQIRHFRPDLPTLEDVFARVVGAPEPPGVPVPCGPAAPSDGVPQGAGRGPDGR